MKIAIPTEKKEPAATVAASFGRAPYFYIYDTQTRQAEFMDNPGASGTGGAGVKSAQLLIDNLVEAVITPRCGENAAETLKASGIKIYKAQDATIDSHCALFMEEKLQPLLEIHPGFHNHG